MQWALGPDTTIGDCRGATEIIACQSDATFAQSLKAGRSQIVYKFQDILFHTENKGSRSSALRAISALEEYIVSIDAWQGGIQKTEITKEEIDVQVWKWAQDNDTGRFIRMSDRAPN